MPPTGFVYTVSGFVYTPRRVVCTVATLIPWRHHIYLRKRNEKNNGYPVAVYTMPGRLYTTSPSGPYRSPGPGSISIPACSTCSPVYRPPRRR